MNMGSSSDGGDELEARELGGKKPGELTEFASSPEGHKRLRRHAYRYLTLYMYENLEGHLDDLVKYGSQAISMQAESVLNQMRQIGSFESDDSRLRTLRYLLSKEFNRE